MYIIINRSQAENNKYVYAYVYFIVIFCLDMFRAALSLKQATISLCIIDQNVYNVFPISFYPRPCYNVAQQGRSDCAQFYFVRSKCTAWSPGHYTLYSFLYHCRRYERLNIKFLIASSMLIL